MSASTISGPPPYFDAGHNRFLTTDGDGDGPRGANRRSVARMAADDVLLTGTTPHASATSSCSRPWPPPSASSFAEPGCSQPRRRCRTKAPQPLPIQIVSPWARTIRRKRRSGPLHMAAEATWPSRSSWNRTVAWENFEACMLTSQGRFLTGGYATSRNPKSVTTDRGFKSAKELLRWWCNTQRRGFGKRFMAWVSYDRRNRRDSFLGRGWQTL